MAGRVRAVPPSFEGQLFQKWDDSMWGSRPLKEIALLSFRKQGRQAAEASLQTPDQ